MRELGSHMMIDRLKLPYMADADAYADAHAATLVDEGRGLTRRGFLEMISAPLSALMLPACHGSDVCTCGYIPAGSVATQGNPDTNSSAAFNAPYPLRRGVSGMRHLQSKDGAPYFLLGDTAWSIAVSASREDVRRYIADRKAQGFNAITFNAIEHEFAGGNGNQAPFNWYHEPPFCGRCDFSRPNEAYWSHVDFIVRQAAQAGMLCLIFPAYEGYSQGNQGWYVQMAAQGRRILHEYGEWLARRYLAYDNVMWVAGGDNNAADKSLTLAVVTGIRSVSEKWLVAWHGARNCSAAAFWGDDLRWFDFNTIYDRFDESSAFAMAAYQSVPVRPFARIEDTYENPVVGRVPAPAIRWLAWSSALQGGTGAIYGDVAVWRFNGPGVVADPTLWTDALARPAGASMRYLKQFYESVAWTQLAPDLAKPAWMTAEASTGSVAALAGDCSFGVAYARDAAPGMSFDMRKLAGRQVHIRWYDPTSGATWEQGTYPTTGERILANRNLNSGGCSDWALLIESR
jgi:hypothetical protein